MRRLCERPGCSQPSEVIFGIDADRLVVWFEGLDGNIEGRAGMLCRRHAESMVVPNGWTLDDRRTAAPPLFATRTAPSAAPPRPARKPRRVSKATGAAEPSPTDTAEPAPSGDGPSQLSLDMSAGASAEPPAAPTSPGVGPTDETAPLWQPKFDQSDDLGGLLTAHSPLLSRAFKLEAGDDDTGQGDDAEEAADS